MILNEFSLRLNSKISYSVSLISFRLKTYWRHYIYTIQNLYNTSECLYWLARRRFGVDGLISGEYVPGPKRNPS